MNRITFFEILIILNLLVMIKHENKIDKLNRKIIENKTRIIKMQNDLDSRQLEQYAPYSFLELEEYELK